MPIFVLLSGLANASPSSQIHKVFVLSVLSFAVGHQPTTYCVHTKHLCDCEDCEASSRLVSSRLVSSRLVSPRLVSPRLVSSRPSWVILASPRKSDSGEEWEAHCRPLGRSLRNGSCGMLQLELPHLGPIKGFLEVQGVYHK
ncbi:hypothetical protein TcWFU_007630 [Taenia crassiceps]|uniref:Secreted protein n=1 Tax=Taenia crassiceps TaxID=6207 RepID=A0ABR4Q936_9CEST